MDQENAHASAEIADRLSLASRLFEQARDAFKAFEAQADNAKLLELDIQPIQTALTDMTTSLKAKIRMLEDNRAALTPST